MVAKDLPDLLPAGWTLQFNALKTGRIIKYYVNSGTGQKLFSKDDVIQYAKGQTTELQQSETREKSVESNSKNNHQMHHIANNTNECPEWLPPGWILELKPKNSDRKSGSVYKCYMDPSTGRRFYSKPQVFKYLRNVKQKSCPSKKSVCRRNKVVIEKSTVEDLPPGWIRVLKITKTASRVRRDPYYTDPASGIVFRSKKEVHRYLEAGDTSRHAILAEDRNINDQTSPAPTAKIQKLEHLPARRQLFAGKGSSELLDVESIALSDSKDPRRSSAKMISAGTMLPAAPMADNPRQKCSKEDVIDNGAESNDCSNVCLSTPPKAEVSTGGQDENVSADNEPVTTPAADVKQDQSSLERGIEWSSQQKIQGNLSKSKEKKEINLPFRTSKRLAGLEPDLIPNLVSSMQALQNATISCKSEHILVNDSADNGPALTFEADIKQKHYSVENNIKGSSTRKAQNSLKKSNSKKGVNLPRRTSKRLAGIEPDVVPISASVEHSLQNAASSSKGEVILTVDLTSVRLAAEGFQQHKAELRAEFPHHASDTNNPFCGEPSHTSQNSLHRQAVPNDLSKGLETEKINDEKSDPLIPPFEEFWSDPCLEFAFKTLTGAITVEDAAYNVLVSTPAADILDGNDLLVNRIEENSNRNTKTNSSTSKERKEVNLPCQSSKRHSGFQFKPMDDSTSKDSSLCFSAIKSSKIDAVDVALTPVSLAGGPSLHHQTRPGMEHAQHGSRVLKTSRKKILNKNKEPVNANIATEEQSHKLDPNPLILANDFWSDSCLEFAFKTLTSSMPGEDNFPIHSYFQQQVNTSQAQRESYFLQQVETSHIHKDGSLALPDFGLPSFFQTDISAHFDFPENQPSTQLHLPLNNPSLLPSGNVNLPTCSSIASQPPHLEGNKGISGKVNP